MKEIRIELNIEKKHMYMTLAAVLLIAGLTFAIADVDQQLPWHDSSTIEVTASGQTVSLQEALDQNLVEVSHAELADHAAEADRADNADKVGGVDADELCWT
jgi:hypothetical protein